MLRGCNSEDFLAAAWRTGIRKSAAVSNEFVIFKTNLIFAKIKLHQNKTNNKLFTQLST